MNVTTEIGSLRTSSSEKDYYIEIANAFASLSYQGVYIVDLSTRNFTFLSDHPLLRCGLKEKEILKIGPEYFSPLLPTEERVFLKNINSLIASGYKNIPLEYRKQLIFFINFHIIIGKRPTMVCHKLRLIDFDENGNPRQMIGIVSPSVHCKGPIILVKISGTSYTYHYLHESNSWKPYDFISFSDEEKEMLRLTIQGHTIKEIASLMCKSTETIKYYRRQIFSKLNVKNIAEAISFATHYCMI